MVKERYPLRATLVSVVRAEDSLSLSLSLLSLSLSLPHYLCSGVSTNAEAAVLLGCTLICYATHLHRTLKMGGDCELGHG